MRHLLPAAFFLFAACSSGGSEPAATGQVSFVLTDAATDELSLFEVDVGNITLTKLNGNTVSAVPRATRVDFVDLTSLGELIAGTTLEAGVYRSLSLEFDFANAEVVIGGQTTPAVVRDRAGNALTGIVPVRIDFAEGSRPVVGSLRHNLFVLDLDLDQSLSVDVASNTVTFTPVLSAEVDPSNPKPTATSGILQSVSFDSRSFTVERRALDGSVMGTFTVVTDSATVFQLDGTVGVGATALGALPGHIGQRVFVQGAMARTSRVLNAVAVETGNGVPGNGQDWVLGHVVARTGGPGSDATLSVLGRSRDVSTATRRYNTTHTVSLSHAETRVLRRGAGNSLDADAINIGQLVWIFGDLTGTSLNAASTTGVARLLPTPIFGVVTAPLVNTVLTLDLVRFGLRDVAAFDFDVSGQVQADPDAFTVDVSGLATAGITTGSKLRVLGWINAVDAVGADATAISLTNRSTTARILFCQWSPPRRGVIGTNVPAGDLLLDVGDAGVAAVADGFGTVPLVSSPMPALRPLAGAGIYRIVQGGAIAANLSFPAFRTALLQRAADDPVFRVGAFGTFDEATQVFSALTITVILD